MEFSQELLKGTLIKRYKRFLADVRLESGEEITAHCANPGSMLGCSEPGSAVLLSVANNPRRKLKHQLEIIYNGPTAIGVHTGRPNGVVAEAIAQGRIEQVFGYSTLRREVNYGRNSRIDILLEGNGLRPCYIEVKNVTMAEGPVACFPDAVTERGTKHLHELVDRVRRGNRAMICFVAQREDVESFRPCDEIDPVYSQTLRDAIARGVEALCFRAKVTPTGIELDKELEIDLTEP